MKAKLTEFKVTTTVGGAAYSIGPCIDVTDAYDRFVRLKDIADAPIAYLPIDWMYNIIGGVNSTRSIRMEEMTNADYYLRGYIDW